MGTWYSRSGEVAIVGGAGCRGIPRIACRAGAIRRAFREPAVSAVLRYTVVDADGTASFVGPGYLLKMLAAAASRSPATVEQLLEIAGEFDPEYASRISLALAGDGGEWPDGSEQPFRAVDDADSRRALEPARSGLVVFNLDARRIVQIQNTYAELKRADRGRMRRNGRPVQVYYQYELPDDWTIVP